LTGLTNPNFGFGGLDGAVHLAEDCINPKKVVPLATILSVVTAVITAFLFAVSMLYCISDIRLVLATRTGLEISAPCKLRSPLTVRSVPIFEIFSQATKSKAASTVLMVLMICVAFLTLLGSVLAASRITWAFARDEALIFARFIKKIDRKQGVPLYALLFNSFWILALGCIFLASTTGKNPESTKP